MDFGMGFQLGWAEVFRLQRDCNVVLELGELQMKIASGDVADCQCQSI